MRHGSTSRLTRRTDGPWNPEMLDWRPRLGKHCVKRPATRWLMDEYSVYFKYSFSSCSDVVLRNLFFTRLYTDRRTKYLTLICNTITNYMKYIRNT